MWCVELHVVWCADWHVVWWREWHGMCCVKLHGVWRVAWCVCVCAGVEVSTSDRVCGGEVLGGSCWSLVVDGREEFGISLALDCALSTCCKAE